VQAVVSRKEVEMFVLVAEAGIGRRLARLLAEPSLHAVAALLGREKEQGGRLGVAPCRSRRVPPRAALPRPRAAAVPRPPSVAHCGPGCR
jgi:hypothetical protein